VRLTRGGQETRLDKPSRTVRPGDQLTFALAGRALTLRVEGVGERAVRPARHRNSTLALIKPCLDTGWGRAD
jgi:ribosome-associated heat shock protein Hsp15